MSALAAAVRHGVTMQDTDRDYYRRRLEEELQRSYDADCDVARIAHRKLAEFYQRILAEPVPPSYRARPAAGSSL
jgi:hypothetical protein